MKKIITIVFAFTFILMGAAPSVADAAWWNPFSWFKKQVPAVSRPTVNTTTPSQTPPPVIPPVVKEDVPTTTVKVLPPTAKPPVTTKPVQAKPVVKTIEASSTASTTSSVGSSSQKPASVVMIPTYVLNSAYTPSGFISPRSVKNGTILLVIEANHGTSSQAIGNWYTDKIVWKVVSEEFRSGDLTVSISSGQKTYEDVAVINELHTTNLAGHVASDPIVFTVNGQTPRKGNVVIMVDSIYGHMKNPSSTEIYGFYGTPLVGPSFRITD